MNSSAANLPTGWISTKLGDLYTFEYGKSLTKGARAADGIYPVYGSSGVVGMHDKFLIEGSAIIVGRKGAAGSVSYSTENCWPIDTTYYVRDDKNLCLKFSYYLLRSLNLAKLEASTAIPGLNRNHAYDEIVLLPPLKEQHRIVAKIEELFSELDKGIENLKTAQSQLKVYRQALLKHAFEGKLTAQWRAERNVTPAKAGAQPLNDMDSRLPPAFARVTGNDKLLETAEALLKRIQQERAQRYQQQLADWEKSPSIPLFQRGKPTSTAPIPPLEKGGRGGISKPKPPKSLPPLTAEELAELPELPEGWGWVKLGELVWSVKDGPHFSPKYSETGVPFISGGNIRPDGIDFKNAKYISSELHEELSRRCKPEVGDVLYTKGGTTGIARVNTYDIDFNVWVHVAVLKLTAAVKPFYLQHVLNSSFCYSQAQKFTHGVGNQDLGLTRMINIALAVCSTEEQDKIVEIIDDKMSIIDQLDQTITTSLQQAEALRQSILKKAFSGQLVPQDPNDEPASELLARIRTEKAVQPNNKKDRL
jgi:type I restriction enzyme S subunit